jgi:hypothetical protein
LGFALANEEVRRSFGAGVVVLKFVFKFALKFLASMAAVIALQQNPGSHENQNVASRPAMAGLWRGYWRAWRLKNAQNAR